MITLGPASEKVEMISSDVPRSRTTWSRTASAATRNGARVSTLPIVTSAAVRSLLAMSVRLNSASANWNAPIPRDTETAQVPRKHRSKFNRSASRIADSPIAAPVSRSISPPRKMTLKFLRSRRALAIEIEFVAMVRQRSGGISLAKAKLVLPLSRNTVDAPESKGRAAKAKARFSFESFKSLCSSGTQPGDIGSPPP